MRDMVGFFASTVLFAACGGSAARLVEEDKGPLEATLDEVSKSIWPGSVRDDGSRYVRRQNGFFDGEPTAYWFFGLASRATADIFWFCRESDTACPLANDGSVDFGRVIGAPVFSARPGDSSYSPFWLVWVVRVGDDYVADSLKSADGVTAEAEAKRVRVEQLVFDHGGGLGPGPAIIHCALVLDGTELENNGVDLIGKPGVPSHRVELREGWQSQHRVKFYDFTVTEGAFVPDPAAESITLMPTADIYVFFRDCKASPKPSICGLTSGPMAHVGERGVEKDLTNDGDLADNNSVISGFPRQPLPGAEDRPYSPLWRVNEVYLNPEFDAEVPLIDTSADQDISSVKTTGAIRDLIERGRAKPVQFASEVNAGNQVRGNDGLVLFNCPSQAQAR